MTTPPWSDHAHDCFADRADRIDERRRFRRTLEKSRLREPSQVIDPVSTSNCSVVNVESFRIIWQAACVAELYMTGHS
jgi:hypothetical protein